MGDDMQAYKDIFVSESAEYVQSIVDGMLQLESNPNDLEPVEVVFRGAHSLKGMSAAMGYERTADLTHKMEGLMDTVRKREQAVDASLVDLVLRAVDIVKLLIDDEMNGRTVTDTSAIAAELAARAAGGGPAPAPVEAPGAVPMGAEQHVEGEEGGTTMVVRVSLEDACVLKSVRAYLVIKRLSHMGTVVETHPSARDIEDENFEHTFDVVLHTTELSADVSRAVSAVSEVSGVEITEAAPAPSVAAPVADRDAALGRLKKSIPKLSETQTVRIAIGHLDSMVNLVGELVIVRSRLENLARPLGHTGILETLEDLHRISSELQHEVMQTRMVPVGNIFNRFPRMVRDLARDLGKDVAFEMEGLDIELDRTVLDEIGDPLVHLLRNAVDHGVESAEQRAAAGKPARGTVRLSAMRERDQVQLVVSDDGGGMDPDHIWAKAVERGIVTADARETCSTEDVLMLTCVPGFSTADQATKVSGRGVGMDVVRGKIEYLGGSLTIRSKPGVGTEFVLSLPLTLAIIQALLLDAGGQTFALPLSFVNEVYAAEDVKVDTIDSGPVMTLRDGRVIPLYRLDVLIGSHDDHTRPPEPGEHVVLVEIADQARGLTVSRLVGRQEVVIKPLAKMLKQIRGLGGATVLGDGSVALILDPRMLFSMGEWEHR
ncbi:MAG: chemotaxis protein CheA [Coriobacteriia bacterium]|nr:chemotaxis protein CheA [Coriobacteriia bacterium]